MTEIIKSAETSKEDIKADVEQRIVGSVTPNELDAINLRNNIIDSKQIELNLLKQERATFLMMVQNKYKLSSKKEYLVDKEGKIIEIIKV